MIPPTRLDSTVLRGGPGAFAAPRGESRHQGVDIVANQSSADKEIYRVRAVAAGTVAYAQYNGASPESGYGFTVVVDHATGLYTLYAHLATLASGGLVQLHDSLEAGAVVGYLADLANGEKSSGNVLANVVAPWDKIQLHFEQFNAPPGRTSKTSVAVLKQGGRLLDPTSDLVQLGYGSNDGPPSSSASDDPHA